MANEKMTVLEMIQKDVEAENNDMNKYTELAKQADEEYPGHGYGGILRDIAHEERSHHKYLMAIMDDIKKHQGTA